VRKGKKTRESAAAAKREEDTAPASTENALSAESAARAERAVSIALSYVGAPYRRGGTSQSGIDCSGLCCMAYQAIGVSIPHWSTAIASTTPTHISRQKEIAPGDILCFNDHSSDGRIDHVGLVTAVENGIVMFVHATSHGGVMVSRLTRDSHWERRFRFAARPLAGVSVAAQRYDTSQIGD